MPKTYSIEEVLNIIVTTVCRAHDLKITQINAAIQMDVSPTVFSVSKRKGSLIKGKIRTVLLRDYNFSRIFLENHTDPIFEEPSKELTDQSQEEINLLLAKLKQLQNTITDKQKIIERVENREKLLLEELRLAYEALQAVMIDNNKYLNDYGQDATILKIREVLRRKELFLGS